MSEVQELGEWIGLAGAVAERQATPFEWELSTRHKESRKTQLSGAIFDIEPDENLKPRHVKRHDEALSAESIWTSVLCVPFYLPSYAIAT